MSPDGQGLRKEYEMRRNLAERGMRLAGICMMLPLLLSGCGQDAPQQEDMVIVEQEDEGLSYNMGTVVRGDVVKTERLRCTYRQMSEQAVSFPMSGRLVDRVYVKEGDTVKKGQLLAELSSEELERKIKELEYRIARNELLLGYTDIDEAQEISGMWVNYLYYSGMTEGDKKNLDSRIESTQRSYRYQREDYGDALETDRKELEKLQGELKSSRVYAVTDGVVYKLKERLEGATSQKDEVVMTIVDTSECLFETEAPEAAGYFREGETVSMNISYSSAAGQYELLPWHMKEWGDTQLFLVESGPENAGIEVGTAGTIQVVADRRENVLCIPLSAIHTADDGSYVYVLNEDNMREVKWVETGLAGDDTVEILSGLTEGERVIRKW